MTQKKFLIKEEKKAKKQILTKVYEFFLIVLFFALIVGTVLFVRYLTAVTKHSNMTIEDAVFTSRVTGSGSMLNTLQPENEIELTKVGAEERIYCGHVYVFEQNNKTIIHRFVYETTGGLYYFKGDNNPLYDAPINRSQIKYKHTKKIID